MHLKTLAYWTLALAGLPGLANAAETPPELVPTEYVYKKVGDIALKVAVFAAPQAPGGRRPAVAIFHGGGWNVGQLDWTYGDARLLAAAGCVGVGVQYRLSSPDRTDVTPLDAIADARDAIRWIRQHADELGIDPNRIAALGWSAGGHLAACIAIFTDPLAEIEVSSAPNALVLWFPALALEYDDWIPRLLHGRADPMKISPDQYVRPGWPTTLILIGRLDKTTPAAGAEKFCRLMQAAGNRCDLHIYDHVGHSFEDAPGHIDPAVAADSKQRTLQFLRDIGLLPAETPR
jgi:acetyl esterase/lipase